MREIKFRGQRIDNNEWVYGYFVKAPNGEYRIYWQPFEDATSNTYHIVKSESIGQFTGLTDKNEKDIYEGDIVDFIYNEDKRREMVECLGGCMALGNCLALYQTMMDSYRTDLEVIGNILDNPELLK